MTVGPVTPPRSPCEHHFQQPQAAQCWILIPFQPFPSSCLGKFVLHPHEEVLARAWGVEEQWRALVVQHHPDLQPPLQQ